MARHTRTLTADGRATFNAQNIRGNSPNRYSYGGQGDFGGGTVTIELSYDGGTTWVDVIDNGSAVTFTADRSDNIDVNSDPLNPTIIGFSLAGSTDPNLLITLMDNR